jgi:hypothetical protein
MKMATNIDLDTIVKAIHELPYPDLRMFADSLADILGSSFEDTELDADALVPVLYNWSKGWEPSGS